MAYRCVEAKTCLYHNHDSTNSEQIAAAVQVLRRQLEISSEQEEDSCYPARSDVDCRRESTPGGFVTGNVSRDPPAFFLSIANGVRCSRPWFTRARSKCEQHAPSSIARRNSSREAFTSIKHALVISTAYRDVPERPTTSSQSSTKIAGSHEWLRRRLRACDRRVAWLTVVDFVCARRAAVVCSLALAWVPFIRGRRRFTVMDNSKAFQGIFQCGHRFAWELHVGKRKKDLSKKDAYFARVYMGILIFLTHTSTPIFLFFFNISPHSFCIQNAHENYNYDSARYVVYKFVTLIVYDRIRH